MVRRGMGIAAAVVGILWSFAGAAFAIPPQIASISIAGNSVTATSATLQASIKANGSSTTYRFEYITQAAYEANVEAGPPREPFAGAAFVPSSGAGPVGGGTSPVSVSQHVGGLASSTAYRYRLRAVNAAAEVAFSVTRPFATEEPTNVFELLDHRGWEMVSPADKGGGAIQPPGAIFGGGVFQAAAGGGSFTYSSADSFGEGAGAPVGSQYIATRTGAGWSTANITTPLLSGSYGSEPDGVPYQLFSGDIGFGLLSNGERCRGVVGGECPVANLPLPGSGAPAGYRDYYRRTASGAFESLLTAAGLLHTILGPEQFELRLVATTPDLGHVVVSTCAALSGDATEVAASGGCDQEDQNLYEWSGRSLSLVNRLPGEAIGSLRPAQIAASAGAISEDGSRVYFTSAGEIYLDEGEMTKAVTSAPGARFEAASTDGSVAYLIDSGELLRYSAATGDLTTIDVGPGVEGVLGVSADGSKVYYAKSGAVYLRVGSNVTEVASSAAPGDWPAAIGTARVTADGLHLLFLSEAELTGYPNEGEPEVFLYGPPPGGGAALLTCVSCNPSGERTQGGASIPGARRNGRGVDAFDAYKPRALSADGERVFFETSDSLVPQDTNHGTVDVYEWEAAGEGTCGRADGCVQLISGGREATQSWFLDADESGSEAFFLTAASLDPSDPGEYGGFPVPEAPIPCVGDACQVLPEAPEDPSPATLVPNSGNPAFKVTGVQPGGKVRKKKHRKRRKHNGEKAKKQSKRGGRRRA